MPNIHTSNQVAFISATSTLLGLVIGSGCILSIFTKSRASAFVAILGLFHELEFYITAQFQGPQLSWDSFVLNNGVAYWIAMSIGALEYHFTDGSSSSKILSWLHFPPWVLLCVHWVYTSLAILLIVSGQLLRSFAMVHAGKSFSHHVASEKRQEHSLVKSGVYHYVRHPSYVGFFAWALGTQLLLQNVFSLVAFTIVLWDFFSKRIVAEEMYLVKFFDEDYKDYRKNTPSGIPFVP
ncbi:protein-S isoprenylcysteine O-methyltransferase Mam4 [Schizosaccharomyces cryophilus OY26]|uniref:Protein-S-isoprenylcysteine O-methyltransferase n=1 Tax=Schizosaccharomyces cryophilus (strain OY26 / ATCC MYA-4695 / CBS 11777 / NBRC 106824 / NRRL Y48691) TaxID=653667 RepID=S9X182_SCHCR|nr:protein-S isoprenylcysteine O-methyltransferase Mam4 [Schizosaccharomyces cryophilus OY26]EPY50867.1 protein-S isoprenylcysteine O-methyltransferase Mam4 [Schizosaccharomyces cryophilus OY26]